VIDEEGFATTKHTTFEFGGVPLFYTPYLKFPVNQERASGLLTGSYGYSSKTGVQLYQPFFWAISDSADLLITPFAESEARVGTQFDYRQVFSREHRISGGLVYSNERLRDGKLLGTNIGGITDPTIDDDRLALYYNQNLRSRPREENPYSFAADLNYVSDDLMLRELDLPKIGSSGRRYTTSRLLLRNTFGEYVSSELSSEYNQSLREDDDFVLQRIPELSVDAQRTFRPFGYNQYGAKVVPALNVNAVRFDRDRGVDGTRIDATPSVTVPFRYRNWFSSAVAVRGRFTKYALDENFDISSNRELDDSNDRALFNFSYATRTAVERVFEIDPENWFTTLSSIGIKNKGNRLQRLKHVIEPTVQFTWIPPANQDDLPLFDSVDRVRSRAQVRYGLRTALLGRFSPSNPGGESIPEISPLVEDLPTVDIARPVTDMFDDELPLLSSAYSLRKGEIRELVELTLAQTYDFNPQSGDESDRLSDLGGDITFTPNRNFGVAFETNFDVKDTELSSWGLRTQLDTDRGDSLRATYSYIDNSVSQLEGNLEVVLQDRLRAGYYTRYDDQDSEIVETGVGLRLLGDCDCWHMDLGFQKRSNPDKNLVLVSVTLRGLGDIVQQFSVGGPAR
jgi:lipopolysaccharide assembly outer membrane protein LptD (OstA)